MSQRLCEKCDQKKSDDIFLFRFPKHEECKKKCVEVVKIANSIFEKKKKNMSNDILSDHKLLQKLSISALTHISSCRPNLLLELENCHRTKLFKEIFAMFFSLKVKHICKLKNDSFKTFVRKVCKKIPIYKNE